MKLTKLCSNRHKASMVLTIKSKRCGMPANNAKPFNRGAYHWRPDINYREHPEAYHVGKGEQGVLICQPYKSEIGQYCALKHRISQKKAATRFMLYLKII